MFLENLILRKVLIKNNSTSYKTTNKVNEKPKIFTLWWQGIEKAPKLVRLCINSIEKNNPHHQLVIIDCNNYSDYVKIDNDIVKMLVDDKISITHFSDILRCCLLSEFPSSIWIDATVYVTGPIYQNSDMVFTKHISGNSDNVFVPNGRWSIWAISGNNELFAFAYASYVECVKKVGIFTYFLLDYILYVGFKNNVGGFQSTINNTQDAHEDAYMLSKILEGAEDRDITELFLQSDTYIWKLSNKISYSKERMDKLSRYNSFFGECNELEAT
jgi:hypothetical protein